jgi:hypothetical protein
LRTGPGADSVPDEAAGFAVVVDDTLAVGRAGTVGGDGSGDDEEQPATTPSPVSPTQKAQRIF